MGTTRTRRLNLVAASATGAPVAITLGAKSARRLAGLLHASQGAELAVKGAQQQHALLRQQYQEIISSILETHGLESVGGVNHDCDRGVLTVTPAAPPTADAAVPT